jgi:ectoine hydroxylase-related dioxygenase (phytanoyl-CoA dioxygenase family)
MTNKEFYDENGYFVAKGLFNIEEISILEKDFDRIVHQISATGENINARWSGPEVDRIGATQLFIAHTHNVQQFSSVWLNAFLNPKFIAATQELIGDDVILHHSKLFQKPAEKGAAFPMHQDWEYFPTELDTMMAGIIHVSKATEEMGCFRVYPGTHKLGKIDDTKGNHESELLSKYPIEGSTPLVAEPGDVVFFHYCLIHGSLPNTSQEIRKTVLVQMHSGRDHVEEGNTHPNARLTLSGWNYHSSRTSANND